MMILSTKLHTPLNRIKLIQRPALIQSLNKGMQASLTTVVAPAGYGKTTLLSDWVKQCDAKIAWVSLDKQEDDFGRFWNYVIAAIDKENPEFGTSNYPIFSNIQSESFLPMITTLLNELSMLPSRLVLILDDFHVIKQPHILSSMTFLLEHLPHHIHVFIASRNHLTLPTARLKARGELLQIVTEDMRFQLEEGISYFQDCMELTLSEEDINLLVKITEGWISGLHLAGLSIKRSKDHSDFINRFSGKHSDIENYLLEEVFDSQPEEVRSFLLETSILSRMNSSLCEAVTGQKNGQKQLEMLERLQMFIFPLDDEKIWYRYHHLFSDFLQRKFQEIQPDRWAQSHARAASWLRLEGFIEEAMDHLIAGNHFSDAASFIEKWNPSLTQLKRSVLFEWLTVLPDDYIAGRPMLEIFNIAVLIVVGEQQLVKSRLTAIKDKLVEDEWQPYAGIVSLIGANVAFNQKELELASAYFEEFERYMPGGNYLQMVGGNTAQNTDNDNLLAYINDLRMADSFMQYWIKAWENKKSYPFVGYFFVSYSELLYEWNRLDEAEGYAMKAMERKDIQPFARIIVRAAINLSQIRIGRGHSGQVLEILEQVQQKIDSPDQQKFIEKIEAQKAFYSLKQGELSQVSSWLRTCDLNPTDDIPLYRIPEYLVLARALEQCGEKNKALILLRRLHQLVSREDRLRDKIRVLILQSMVYQGQENTEAAMSKLAEALHLAEPHGYIRTFVDEGERMARLLSSYLQLRQAKFMNMSTRVSLEYVKKLLNYLNVFLEGTSSYMAILTAQELKILRLIEKGLSNKQIAAEIFISHETVKTHIKNIYRKLESKSRIEAILRGKELGLL